VADASIAGTGFGSVVSSAAIRREQTGSSTLDAWLALRITTSSASLSSDAVIVRERVASLGADARVLREAAGSLVADASIVDALKWGPWSETESNPNTLVTGSFPAGAIIGSQISASITGLSIIRRTQAASLTADAGIFRAQTGSFTAAAWTVRRSTGSFTADAIDKRTMSGTVGADANIAGTFSVITGSFTADAVIKRTMGVDWGTLVRSGGTPSAWFRLNETTGNYLDSGQTGLIFGPSTEARGVSGYVDTAIRLPGTGTIVTTNFPAFVGMSDLNVVSFETWIYIESLVATRRGLWCGGSSGTLAVELDASHHVRVAALYTTLAVSTATVTTGWNHIVWTRAGSGATHKIYINGIESSLSTNATNALSNPVAYRYIGQVPEGGNRFTGIVDEIVIYGRTLSATEISTHASSLYLSFTAQATIARARTGSFTAAAELFAGTRTGAFTAQACIQVPQTGSFSANAIIVEHTGSFTADAYTIRPTVTGTVTAKASLRAHLSSAFTAAAIITRGGRFTAQASLFGHQTTSFSASAWIYVPRTYVVPGDPGSGYVYANPTPIAKIVVGGVDITDDVMFETASFTSAVNGFPGACGFRVRDTLHSHAFVAGAETYLEIDGKRRWGGYITQVTRGFAFPYDDTTDESSVARFFTLTGVDYNILFAKRVLFDKANPTNVAFKSWPVDTAADTVIRYIFDHYTTLADDGCVYDSVTNAGTINPDKVASVGTVGFTFGDAMTEINRLINAVWYFDAFKNLHFTSADDRDNPIGLSDNPGANEVGFREAAFLADGTKLANDVFVWGAGTGSRRMAFAHVESGPSKNAHNLWQYAEFTSQMYHQWAVDERASSILNGNDQSLRGWKNNRDAWTLTIFDTRFSLGHKVLVTSDTFGLSDVYPIRKTTITFPTPWDVKTEMLLSHELDDPWNFYEFWFPRLSPPEWTIIDPPPFPCTNCADCPDLCVECNCGVTDTFTRTVASGWGTSDAGLSYGPPSSSGLSVNGSVGRMVQTDAYDAPSAGVPLDLLPGAVIEATFEFQCDNTSFYDYTPDPAHNQAHNRQLQFYTTLGSANGNQTYVNFIIASSNLGYQGNLSQYNYFSAHRYNNDDTSAADGYNFNELVPYGWNTGVYKVRFKADYTNTWVKVWQGDTEPGAWTLTLNPNPFDVTIDDLQPGDQYAPSFAINWTNTYYDGTGYGGYHTLSDGVSIDNLRVWVDGILVNNCSGVGIDNFDGRTITGGWGTASSGLAWQGAVGGGGVTAAVAGGEGHYGGGTLGTVADVRQYINDSSMAVFATDFDLIQHIRFDNGPTIISGDYLQYTVGYSDSDAMLWRIVGGVDYSQIGWWHAVIVQFGAGSSQTRIGVTLDIGDQDTVPSTMAWSLIDLSAGVDYNVRWSRVGTTVQARIWETGTTEPATWTVSGTVTADFTLPITYFITLYTRRGTPAVAQGFSTSFVGKETCPGGDPGNGVVDVGVTDGTGTYNARPITPTTMFYLPVRFVAGSTRVWRDGVFQRPGIEYTEYPDLGEIVMGTAVQPDEVLTVDYVANGSL
jgi:hypothetical protein